MRLSMIVIWTFYNIRFMLPVIREIMTYYKKSHTIQITDNNGIDYELHVSIIDSR